MNPSPPILPHQEYVIGRLAQGTPTYVGHDMGLGKTRSFIEAVKRANALRVLIVCPSSAVLVWQAEIARWLPRSTYVVARQPGSLLSEARFTILPHPYLSQANGVMAEALRMSPPFGMTALDEAQAFNAPVSNRIKALRKASHLLGLIVPMSGTPMKNHAGELYNILSIVWPEGLKTPAGTMRTRFDFESEFCKVVMKNYARGRPAIRVIEGSKNVPRLRALMSPFMVRVRKEDVLADLPAIVWDRVQVPLDDSHFPAKDAATMAAIIKTAMGTADNDNALLSALSHTAHAHLMTLRRMLGLAKLRGAKDYIVDLLDGLPADRKVLIFAVHTDVIASLAHHLGDYSPALLTGASVASDREAAVAKFLTDPNCRVFVGNIQAAGTGLTLIGPRCKCSDVVFVESSWTPADNAQAACRVHRIGQKDGVTARMLSAAGTIDDFISALLVRKANDFTQLFDKGAAT